MSGSGRATAWRRGSRRRTVLFAVGLLLVAVLGTSAFLSSRLSGVRIDGVTMSEDEIAVAEDRVLRAVQQQGGDEGDVRDAAVDALRDDMALLAVAGELGVTDIARPAEILNRLEVVNDSRAQAQRRGEVVYGPVNYDERTFYGKALTDIRTAAVDALEDADDAVTDEDIRARFEAQRQEWSAAASTYRLSVAHSNTGSAPDAAVFDGKVSTVTVSYAELQTADWNPEVSQQIQAAQPGDLIGPVPARGDWLTFRLDAVDVDDELALRTYRERIRAQLIDELLDERVAAARERQDVR